MKPQRMMALHSSVSRHAASTASPIGIASKAIIVNKATVGSKATAGNKAAVGKLARQLLRMIQALEPTTGRAIVAVADRVVRKRALRVLVDLRATWVVRVNQADRVRKESIRLGEAAAVDRADRMARAAMPDDPVPMRARAASDRNRLHVSAVSL